MMTVTMTMAMVVASMMVRLAMMMCVLAEHFIAQHCGSDCPKLPISAPLRSPMMSAKVKIAKEKRVPQQRQVLVSQPKRLLPPSLWTCVQLRALAKGPAGA